MKDLRAIRGERKLREMIAEGEHITQDFKFSISDARKIARSISAFANCRGGRLLIGVKDNGTIAGVRNEEDIYVVEQAASRYCRPPQNVEFTAYRIADGARVIVAAVAQTQKRPVMVEEADGRLKAYFRVADENIAAHPLMVRMWQADGESISLHQRHYEALAALTRLQSLTDSRQLALEAHISLDSADEALDTLAAAGLLDFIFDGKRFIIKAR